MILDLYIYPHPVLLQVAEPVETFDDDLKKLVDDMADTMYEGNGVGLAAPQIGLSKRLFVVDTSAPEEPWTLKAYVNPKIIVKDQPIVWNEGCLSLPGLYRDVQTYGMSSSKPKTSKGIGSAKKPKSFAPSHYCTNMPISMAASSSIGSRPLNSASCANRGENAYDAKPKRHIPKAISIAYSPPMPKRIRQHDATSPERRRCRPQCPKKRRRKAIFSGRQTRSFSSISIRPVDV